MKYQRHVLLALICAAGCSGQPGAVRPPDVDPGDAAQAAIEKHDRNADGALSKDELSSAPELASVIDTYDTSSDGALSVDEITAGIEGWHQAGVGARSVPFTVTLDGRPLAGATVRLVPADFVRDGVKPAEGTTNANGAGQFNMAPEDRPKNAPNIPLMQPGLYKVEITHPSTKVPAKYNTVTSLGIEISSGNPGPQGITWALSSK